MSKNKTLNHLVVGYGEVGKAIHKIVGGYYFDLNGKSNWKGEWIDIVHICIPYGRYLEREIILWSGTADLIIVHSSVPVGTCDRLGVVHSPINGVHPHLEKGIRTFPKYFGGKNAEKAAKIFKDFGLQVKVRRYARDTEHAKLWSTTQYGRLINLEKEIYEDCKKNKTDFNFVYTESNIDYNKSYTKLGRPEVVRPYLKHIPGKIGGHCIIPNAKLLKIKL